MCIYDSLHFLCRGEILSLVLRCPLPGECTPHIRWAYQAGEVCELCWRAGVQATINIEGLNDWSRTATYPGPASDDIGDGPSEAETWTGEEVAGATPDHAGALRSGRSSAGASIQESPQQRLVRRHSSAHYPLTSINSSEGEQQQGCHQRPFHPFTMPTQSRYEFDRVPKEEEEKQDPPVVQQANDRPESNLSIDHDYSSTPTFHQWSPSPPPPPPPQQQTVTKVYHIYAQTVHLINQAGGALVVLYNNNESTRTAAPDVVAPPLPVVENIQGKGTWTFHTGNGKEIGPVDLDYSPHEQDADWREMLHGPDGIWNEDGSQDAAAAEAELRTVGQPPPQQSPIDSERMGAARDVERSGALIDATRGTDMTGVVMGEPQVPLATISSPSGMIPSFSSMDLDSFSTSQTAPQRHLDRDAVDRVTQWVRSNRSIGGQLRAGLDNAASLPAEGLWRTGATDSTTPFNGNLQGPGSQDPLSWHACHEAPAPLLPPGRSQQQQMQPSSMPTWSPSTPMVPLSPGGSATRAMLIANLQQQYMREHPGESMLSPIAPPSPDMREIERFNWTTFQPQQTLQMEPLAPPPTPILSAARVASVVPNATTPARQRPGPSLEARGRRMSA